MTLTETQVRAIIAELEYVQEELQREQDNCFDVEMHGYIQALWHTQKLINNHLNPDQSSDGSLNHRFYTHK
jgi:hypothetical protein